MARRPVATLPDSPASIALYGASSRALERLGKTRFDIDLREADATTRKIAAAYARAWKVARSEATTMAKVAAEARHSGLGLSPADVAKIDRVDRGLFALERQIRNLDRFTGVQISGGANRTVEKVTTGLLDRLADLSGIDRRFTKPSGNAIEGLVLRATGRIEAATRRLDARQSVALKDGLLRGLLLGENPNDTARHIYRETEGAFFGGLARAKTLARTEMADANRYATRLAYTESPLVVGWKWCAALTARTCPACWAMHGTMHDSEEMQYGHQNCRCTMLPVLADDDPADHDLGDPEAMFWNLPRDTQLSIMGPNRLKALEAGAPWETLATLKRNPGWRPSMATTSVADLQGLAELNVATAPGDVIEIPGFTNSSLMAQAYVQGGMTVQMNTGDMPTSGFSVAIEGSSAVIDAREFFGPAGPTHFAAWMTKYGDVLDEPGAHVGMWYDTANGKVVLDVVFVLKDRDEAIALGRANDQIAIFDLGSFEEIATGGTGGYVSNALSTKDDAGKTVRWRDGTFVEVGTIIKVLGTGAVKVKKANGSTVIVWPDQIEKVDGGEGSADKQREDIEKVIEISAQTALATGISTNMTGLTPEDAQETADALTEIVRDWDGIKPTDLTVGSDPGTAFAVTNSRLDVTGTTATSTIEISDTYASNPASWTRDMEQAEYTGHFHSGTADEPQQYVVDHEFAHVADFNLWGGDMEARGDVAIAIANAYGYDTSMARFDKMAALNRLFNNPAFRADLKADLSGYALVNPHELFAEGFAVYRDHGPGTSKAADAIMRAYALRYRDRYGKWPDERDLDTLFGREGAPVPRTEVEIGLRVTVDGKPGEVIAAGSVVVVQYDEGGKAVPVDPEKLRRAA